MYCKTSYSYDTITFVLIHKSNTYTNFLAKISLALQICVHLKYYKLIRILTA